VRAFLYWPATLDRSRPARGRFDTGLRDWQSYRPMERPDNYDNGDFHFVDVHVGARLRHRRQQLGLTQKRLAEAAGVVLQQIHKCESAANRISPGCLYDFARLLRIPVAWFFEGLTPTATGRARILIPEHEWHSDSRTRMAQPRNRAAGRGRLPHRRPAAPQRRP
jgi:transcriptional regulator with XRE-family HTH domain